MDPSILTRRALLIGTSSTALGACAGSPPTGSMETIRSAGVDRPLLIDDVRLIGSADPVAVLVDKRRIVDVGPRQRVAKAARASASINAGGGLLLPGFHDAHVHVRSGGMTFHEAQLEGLASLEAVLDAVRRFAESKPDHAWVVGRGWSYDIVAQGSFPARADLDGVSAARPIYLESYDGHAGWANSAALARAGITASTADPADGRIVREADGRTPAGALLEGATKLLEPHIPKPSEAEERISLLQGLHHLSRLGVTSVNDFADDPRTFERYAALARDRLLPIRVSVSLPLAGELAAYQALAREHSSDKLSFGFLKGFVDGVIESKTAFMLAPYENSETRGHPLIEKDELRMRVASAQAAGFRVALHAIGDGAVRISLDAFSHALQERRRIVGRHRIEHIEVVHPDDLVRFAKLGVIASMQPYHAVPSDEPDEGAWSENLGPERLGRSFAWRQLRDAGATLAFGSDWPVMSGDPLWGLAVALTRKNKSGLPAGGWNAHQRLGIGEALEAYSTGPAVSLGREADLGRVAPGMLADLVIVSSGVDLERPETLWEGERVGVRLLGGAIVTREGA